MRMRFCEWQDFCDKVTRLQSHSPYNLEKFSQHNGVEKILEKKFSVVPTKKIEQMSFHFNEVFFIPIFKNELCNFLGEMHLTEMLSKIIKTQH